MAKKGKPMREKHRRLAPIGLSQEGGDGLETLSQKADEALLRRERYFQTLIENALDAVAVLGSDGKICYESPSFERILGYEAEEMVGRGAFDLVHADDMLTAAEQFEQLMKNPKLTLNAEIRARHKDGSWRTLEVVGRNLLDDPVVAGIVANFRDITERKRMEEALRESELVATATIEGMSDGVMLVGMDGKVAYVNKAFEMILGHKAEELVGTSALELPTYRSSKDRDKARKALQKVITTGYAAPLDMIAITKDGKEVPISFTASVIKDSQGNPKILVAVLRDVSESREAEEKLRRSEEYFRALMENSSDAISVLSGDGVVMYEGSSMERVLGYKPSERVGGNVFDFIHPDDIPGAMEHLAKALRQPSVTQMIEVRTLHKDGSWRDLEVVGSNLLNNPAVKGIVINFRDITERKRMHEALKRSEEYFRSLMENAQDAIVVIGEDVSIVHASPSVERMLGYKQEELVGTDGFSFAHPDDMPLVMKAFTGMGENPDSVARVELRIRHKDGSWRVVEAVAKNLLSDEVVKGIVINWRDITERREAYEDLRRSEECFRALTENALDAIVLLKVDGTVTYEAPSVVHVMGYSPEELVGKQFLDFVHPDDMSSAVEGLTELVQNPGTSLKVELRGRHGDGSWRVLEGVCNNLSNNPAVGGIVVNFRDITRRKRAEERIRLNYEIQTILNNLLRISLTDISLEKQLKLFLEHIVSVHSLSLEAKGSIFLVEDDPEVLVLKAQHGLAAPLLSTCARVPFGRCLCGRAAASGKVQFADCLDERHENRYEGIRGHGHYCVPILADGKVLGVINLYVSEGHRRDEMEEGFLSAVSDVVAGIIQRKKADEALGESEERFRRLVDQAPDIIFRWSAEKGLEYCSPIVSEITGYTPEELLSEPMVGLELARAIDLSLDEDYEKAVKKGASLRHREISFKRKDGRQIYLEMRSHAVRDKEGKVIAYEGILRDATQRKQMEEELRNLSDAVKMTTDSVVVTDMRGRVLEINEAGLRLYGLGDRGDFVGRNPLDAIAPEDRRKALENMAKIMETGQVKDIEYHVLRKDGSRILIETSVSIIKGEDGKPKGLVAVARDITERKLMEEALRRLSDAVRMSTDSIVISDLEGNIVDVNEATLRMYGGEDRGEFIGKSSLDFIAPEYRERAMENLGKALETGKVGGVEYDVVRKDGSRIPVEVSAAIMSGSKGEPVGFVGVSRDISERKRAEEEKKKMEEQLRLAGRLAAVGELSAGVAHELNNPLAAIQGYAQFLTMNKEMEESVRKDVDIIYREALRASRITQNLLSFARQHEPSKSYISLNDVLEKTLELRTHQMKVNNIELVKELAPDLPNTMADFYKMQEVFLNVVVNSEQSMIDAHGRGKLTVRSKKTDGLIQMSFTDDGPGISEENMKKIFDPFFTTKEVGKGTGLGLSICFGIVESHGGRIYARSKLGEGTTFFVEIPIVAEGK